MDFTEDTPVRSKPKPTQSRFGSIRLYLNVFCLIVVAVGLSQAVVAAWSNINSIAQNLDDRISELEGSKSVHLEYTDNPTTQYDAEIIELKKLRNRIYKVDSKWLIASILCVSCGIIFPGAYWFFTLRSLNIRVPWQVVARAYYVGNLGKYVPGKAMVLIMRAAALKPFGASIKLTTLSVFVETLTTMAVGAAIGALIILNMEVPRWLQWMGILTAVCAVTPTLPWIFRPILKLRLPTDDPLSQALDHDYNWRLMMRGWLLSGCSWLFLGTSLYSAVMAIPIANAPGATEPSGNLGLVDPVNRQSQSEAAGVGGIRLLSTFPLQKRNPVSLWVICLAACALSVVAGFVSMLPGGAGVSRIGFADPTDPRCRTCCGARCCDCSPIGYDRWRAARRRYKCCDRSIC